MEDKVKRIAVLTSGGDAPGMNAAIRAVVRAGSYFDLHVYGVQRGYEGLINGEITRLENKDVANVMQRGGTILRTARSEEFRTVEGRQKAADALYAHTINGLVVIGGNGTYTGAHYFGKEHRINIVGLPGTIDNDIFGTDYTIGFDTAVNTAMEAVDKIRDTADSHNRLFFVEVMGRHSGYIALHTAIGSGASAVFLPESEDSVDELVDFLKKAGRRKKLFNMVIVAEGNKNGNAHEIARQVKEMYPEADSKVTVIGHLQRGGSPSAADRVLASRLGYYAIRALLDGEHDIAVGVVNNNVVHTPFENAFSKSKEPDPHIQNIARILSM